MSPELHPTFRDAFASLVCDHNDARSDRIPGPIGNDGRFRSAHARYTVRMNELISHAITASLPLLTRLPEATRALLRLRGGGAAPAVGAAAFADAPPLQAWGDYFAIGEFSDSATDALLVTSIDGSEACACCAGTGRRDARPDAPHCVCCTDPD